jgi:hypothetical protein
LNIEDDIKKARLWIEDENDIRVISHHDVDGISAASIILNFLKRKTRAFIALF